MPRIHVADPSLNYIEHDRGDNVVLAVPGNRGRADWLSMAMPLLPADIRVIAAEWRGCGDSDKPEPAADCSKHTRETHARDRFTLLDAPGISKCRVYGRQPCNARQRNQTAEVAARACTCRAG